MLAYRAILASDADLACALCLRSGLVQLLETAVG
jgi:hypothetical protein